MLLHRGVDFDRELHARHEFTTGSSYDLIGWWARELLCHFQV